MTAANANKKQKKKKGTSGGELDKMVYHGIMGMRFPDGGLLRYIKCVPQQLGDVIVVTNSPVIGHMRSQLTNHQVGIVLDILVRSEKLY